MTSFRTSLSLWVALATIGLTAGCQRVHIGDDDGGGGADAGTLDGGADSDAGASDGGIPCGPVTCTGGQVCCNASCGVCTAPGEGCTTIACTNECADNTDCSPTDYCGLSHCPDERRDGVCIPRGPGDCTEEWAPVCGCDGTTYGNACGAAAAGMVVARVGECDSPPPACTAQDIRGEGACAAILGVMWNGSACVLVGGCSCTGTDCDSIYGTQIQCESANAPCRSCDPQEARGDGICGAEVGVFWDGTACVGHSGCSCVGADCDKGWLDIASCDAAMLLCSGVPTCMNTSECTATEFCSRPRGVCGGAGTCERVPGPVGCSDPGPPVCGCNGITYACDGEANIARTGVAHDGECPVSCTADDVRGAGACEVLLGYHWDGAACQALSGCSCEGTDCARLTPMRSECESAHASCLTPGGTCGGILGATCRSDEWCDYPTDLPTTFCGVADGTGICQPRPTACSFLLDPRCGCDGVTYDNECFANAAGQDIAPCGP